MSNRLFTGAENDLTRSSPADSHLADRICRSMPATAKSPKPNLPQSMRRDAFEGASDRPMEA